MTLLLESASSRMPSGKTSTRRHTAGGGEALDEITFKLSTLVRQRDNRRDSFSRVVAKAEKTTIGESAEEAGDLLQEYGYSRKIADEVVAEAAAQGALTIFAVMDVLRRRHRQSRYAGERVDQDGRASRLLDCGIPPNTKKGDNMGDLCDYNDIDRTMRSPEGRSMLDQLCQHIIGKSVRSAEFGNDIGRISMTLHFSDGTDFVCHRDELDVESLKERFASVL